jgi:DNA-binding transcriptional LysR family regulator
MNLQTLRIFRDVVRRRSFSGGAAQNQISQSAASQAVHQLETHFDVKMIDRSKRPFVLTPEGQICYQELNDVLQKYEAAEARIRSLRHEIGGMVRVAAIYSVGLHDMSRCMQEFMSQFPKAKIRLEFLRPNRVYEAVLNNEVDLGIISYPTAARGITVIPLPSEKMVLVCNPAHRLTRMKRVTIRQLRGEDFVGFDQDLTIRKEIDRHLRQNDVAVNVVMEFDNIETIKQAIEIGAGIGLLPEPTVRKEIQSGTLAAVSLPLRKLRRPIGIVYGQREVLTPTMAKFIEMLQEIKSSAPPGTS